MEELTLLRVREADGPFAPYLPGSLRKLAGRPEGVCVGAVFRGMSCGAVLAEQTGEGQYRLRYLFVDPTARRCGLGTHLLRGLLGVLEGLGARRLTAVYAPSMLDGGRQTLSVLERAGFPPAKPMATAFFAPLGELRPPALTLPQGMAVYSGEELPPQLAADYQFLLADGVLPPFADVGTLPGLSLPLSSFCAVDGVLTGLMLVQHREDDLVVAGLYVARGCRRGRTASALMERSLRAARSCCPPDTEVWASAINRESFALCDRMFRSRGQGRRETEMMTEFKWEQEGHV